MKIQDLIQKSAVLIDLKADDKTVLLTQMAQYLASLYDLKDPENITQKIIEREATLSTGIGFGIAIPHTRLDNIDRVFLIAARCIKGVEFGAIDENPVHLIFMMVSPKNTIEEHSRILTSISKIMSNGEIRQKMMSAENVEEFIKVLTDGENRYG